MSTSPRISPPACTSTAPTRVPTYAPDTGCTVWAERGDDVTLLIPHEKRIKKWRRAWKHALIERANPEWRDLFDLLA